MESKPNVPGYGREEKIGNYFEKEMTLEELDALEVPTVEVIKKGVVQSKAEEIKKPSATEQKHVKEMILHQIDALMMQPAKTEIEKRVRDLKIQKLKEKMGGAGHTGNA
jgi:hypothetical protein